MEALRAESARVVTLARSLSDEEWAVPSDCEGWRVQDVVAHLANTFRMAVDPGTLPTQVAGDIEATQAVHVDAHRDWTPAEVLADYEDMAVKGLALLATFQSPKLAELTFPMDNAGDYPLHFVPDLLTFDHFCHRTNDILKPVGPVDRPVSAAAVDADDELAVSVTVEWMMVGTPQMGGATLAAATTDPLGLAFTGPGGGEWTILPPADGEPVVRVVPGLAEGRRATATGAARDLVLWGTWRRPWKELGVTVEGDEACAAPVLDAIHIY